MKIFIFSTLILISALVWSQDIAADDISVTIDEMVKNNIISPHEAHKAKLKLKNSQKIFLSSTNRMPASVHTQLIDSRQTSDLSKVQIKDIEKEIDHIFRRVNDK